MRLILMWARRTESWVSDTLEGESCSGGRWQRMARGGPPSPCIRGTAQNSWMGSKVPGGIKSPCLRCKFRENRNQDQQSSRLIICSLVDLGCHSFPSLNPNSPGSCPINTLQNEVHLYLCPPDGRWRPGCFCQPPLRQPALSQQRFRERMGPWRSE
jgi:hypothetical protein